MNTHTAPPAATLIVYALHALRSMLLCCIPWLSLGGTSSAVVAQTPNWGPAQWNFPPTTSPIFQPVEVFPRPQDPGNVAIWACPTLRTAGIRGFMDDNGTPSDPNDDREYMVVARSDGILLVNATPRRDVNPGTDPGLPSQSAVEFVGEPNPAASSVYPSPMTSYLDVVADYLNGTPVRLPGGTAPVGNLIGTPYCPPTAQPSYRTWHTNETTNREVAIYRAPSGSYFVYCVNTWRAGLWVVPLTRLPNGELSAGTGGTWETPVVAGTGLGGGHNVYVDTVAGRHALYITDDYNRRVCQLDLSNPAQPGAGYANVICSGSAYHDAMPYADQLFISDTDNRSTLVFDLPLVTPPFVPRSTLVAPQASSFPGGHSVYVDTATPFVEGRVYALEEDARPCASKTNFTILNYSVNMKVSTIDDAVLRAVVPYVEPTGLGYPQFPNIPIRVSPVHNLRGIGRTVFGAQYREGLLLFDMFNDESSSFETTEPGFYDNRSLGSFDTTIRMDGVNVAPPGYPTSNPPNWAPYAMVSYWTGQNPIPSGVLAPGSYDNFLGCWDVAVDQDSGLVYAGLGPNYIQDSTVERFLTSGVFRVRQGHINRYWDATTFPQPSPNYNLGLVPRIVMLQGPPREGKGIIIGDANGGRYASVDAQNNPLRYEYTLVFVGDQQPTGVGGINPAVHGAQYLWDPDPASASNNQVWLNVLDRTQPIPQGLTRTSPLTDPATPHTGWFSFSNVGLQGTRWYCQLLVQEYVGPNFVKTGRWAASRGTWFGVARP